MRLYGYQCDNCKVRSKDKPGNWIEIVTMRVDAGHDWVAPGSGLRSDGTHYCTKECLAEHMKTWKR